MWNILLVGLMSLLLAACSGGKKVHFTQEGGSAAERPSLPNDKFLEKIWSFNSGSGYEAEDNIIQPAWSDTQIFIASGEGRVSALDISNGDVLWRTDLDNSLSAGVGLGDGLVVVASYDGAVVALDEKDGSQVWSASVVNEVLAAPVVAPGVVVIRIGDNLLSGLDTATGEALWTVERTVSGLSVRGVSRPLINGRGAVIGLADGRMLAVDIDTGEYLWETSVGRPRGNNEVRRLSDIDADPLLFGTILYVASFQSRLVAMAMGSPRIIWSNDVSTLKAPGIDSDYLYITDEAGSVVALNRYSGEFIWEQKSLVGRGLSSSVAIDESILVGDFEGNLYRLDKQSGDILARQSISGGAVLETPQLIGSNILVMSESGRVALYRLGG